MAKNRTSDGFVQVFLTIILMLMAGAIAFGIFILLDQRKKIEFLYAGAQSSEQRLSAIEKKIKSEKTFINLTIPSVQKIDDVFLVDKLSTESHLTGIKVRGVMINSTALEQKDVKFRVTIGDQIAEFTIPKISSGSSKKFETVIPNVSVEKATEARMQCLASSVLYFVD